MARASAAGSSAAGSPGGRAAAELVGDGGEPFRRWLVAGRIPGRKVGGLWLIPTEALDGWLHSARGQEEATRDGLDLSASVGQALAGADLDRPPGSATDDQPVRPDARRGQGQARRAPGRAGRRREPDT